MTNFSQIDYSNLDLEMLDGQDGENALASEFALTDRRVARSQRKPPATSENEDDVESGGDDVIEEMVDAVIDAIETQLDTDQGRDELASDIDGLLSEERNDDEVYAIEQTLDDLGNDGTLIDEVILVARGEREKIISESGVVRNYRLSRNDDSAVLNLQNGGTVLVVAEDLTVAEVLDETVETLTTQIEEIAVENGVIVDRKRLRNSIAQTAVVIALDYLLAVEGAKFDFLGVRDEILHILKIPLLDVDAR